MKSIYIALCLLLWGITSWAQDTIQFQVSGNCGMCKNRIEQAATINKSVQASWDVESKTLSLLNVKKDEIEKIRQRILKAGHDVEGEKATEEAYQKLPDCCKFREGGAHGDTQEVNGFLMEETKSGTTQAISGASVYWIQAPEKATKSNEAGYFSIPYAPENTHLVISHVGHNSDTIQVDHPDEVRVIVSRDKQLKEVQVTGSRRTQFISGVAAFRSEILTAGELLKAACCTLSESFETNASVEVNNQDAVTGTRQIELLGLKGIYTQLTQENMPSIGGLAQSFSLNSIPGTWIESVQIMKGSGSVVNGYENMVGQINVELQKPDYGDQVYANIYGNSMGRADVNLNLRHSLNEKWSTLLMLHDNFMYNKAVSFQHNGFRDQPYGNVFSGISRWKFDNQQGLQAQAGVQVYLDDRTGGELDFNPSQDKLSNRHYGIGYQVQQVQAFLKTGYVFAGHTYKSLGLQVSAHRFNQDAYFGQKQYLADQMGLYGNLIYQSIIGNRDHRFRTGVSIRLNNFEEQYRLDNVQQTENVGGGFFEYTFNPNARFDLVAGLRADHHNKWGWMYTPRLHMRYQINPSLTLRASVGKGWRTTHILAENTAAMVSARNLVLGQEALKPEQSWSEGLSLDQELQLWNRPAHLSVQYYRNDFSNQIVVDYENPRELAFYNLEGSSFSNSFQGEFSFQPLKNLEARLAYRYYDVQITYRSGQKRKPLMAPHRAFLNLGYRTGNAWGFDFTLNYIGEKRIPSTLDNPLAYQRAGYSQAYAMMQMQVSKTLRLPRPMDVYLGVENLGNFMQQDAIIAADQPFSKYFDSSLIWGPVTGRMAYAGIRFRIN